MVYVSEIDSDGVSCFYFYALEDHELVFVQRRSCDFIGPIESHNEYINDESIKLENEGSELKSHKQTIIIRMIHIFEVDDHIILRCHVVSNIVVNY